ncbi:PLP-dependent transferase [Fomitiporia mediterranea MF3/22]|uniref:PLP-dependent transferase n=1 Tax=Fomitiporia mediterranea (strain MF3/22) TaxID=694068 RepID=UPI0004408111|nr:PLP-dependent transferase [Fomitiporia mediterranea MF3/22]EJD01652.1 PLP-dependent transferase [Fomitiporia mediterranea MF3/22]
MTDMNDKLPKAIDLSHHLSELSKARQTSPLKGLAKYFGQPGIISLAGGMPAPAYFPLSTLSGEMLVPDSFATVPANSSDSGLSWFWRLFSSNKKERTEHMSIPKYTSAKPSEEISLDVALQYGTAQGLIPLQNFMREFTKRVYRPQYADFTTLVHAGNTDGWGKAMQTLCNPGEKFLTEEWTYPSALASARPYGVMPVAIKIDNEGMRSDDLRKVLEEWDEEARGAKRPHLMYTVPVGQNPTGATMGATRKKEIYNLCIEFDIIIVEDDPYYFLQQGPYIPKGTRNYLASLELKSRDEASEFIASLVPSYLKFDYQGRVIRLDSFSKTIAPGSRLGWFTCNERFAERLERQGETSTQAPCGFGQSIITQLLTKQWGFRGYVRWLRGLRAEYTQRRDFFIDELMEYFDIRPMYVAQGSWAGCTALVARPRTRSQSRANNVSSEKQDFAFGEKPIFSLVPPSSGMFVWLKIHFENHPSFRAPEDKATLEVKLWTKIADSGVLIGPGWMFAATDEIQQEAEGHFRIAFSNAEYDVMKKAIQVMHDVLLDFFEYH